MSKSRALIITYYWPPTGGGGVQRWLKFVKYMGLFNWEPVVFTPSNPERPAYDESLLTQVPDRLKVITNEVWEPYQLYKRVTGKSKSDKIQTAFLKEKKSGSDLMEKLSIWIRGNLFIPDARRFWIAPSVRYLKKELKESPVDVIISTGPPHSAHMIAMKLSQELGIPWLADFRDPWTNIDYYQELKLTGWADRRHHRLEKEVLQSADAVTVISPGMKREFEQIVPRNYVVIPNGYDAEDIPDKQSSTEKSPHFTLSHVGSLTRTRNPLNLWKVLRELIEKLPGFKNDLEIRNVGKMDIAVAETIQAHHLDANLVNVDYLPHNEVVDEQASASILLLLVNDTPNARLILTGKLFEYLASGRPIACIAPEDGDAAALIRETHAGETFGFTEEVRLKKFIQEAYTKFKQGTLTQDSVGVERYERKALTGQMCQVLNDLLKQP